MQSVTKPHKKMWQVRVIWFKAWQKTLWSFLVWHVGSLVSAVCPASLSCFLWRAGGKPTPFRQNWQRYRSWGQARAQIKPALCFKTSLSTERKENRGKNKLLQAHINTSQLKRILLMRRLYLTALQEVRGYFGRGLQLLWDCYPRGTNTVWYKDGYFEDIWQFHVMYTRLFGMQISPEECHISTTWSCAAPATRVSCWGFYQ